MLLTLSISCSYHWNVQSSHQRNVLVTKLLIKKRSSDKLAPIDQSVAKTNGPGLPAWSLVPKKRPSDKLAPPSEECRNPWRSSGKEYLLYNFRIFLIPTILNGALFLQAFIWGYAFVPDPNHQSPSSRLMCRWNLLSGALGNVSACFKS